MNGNEIQGRRCGCSWPDFPHDLVHRPPIQLLVRDDLEGDAVLQKRDFLELWGDVT
jgi:hypothetical protein